MESVSCPRCRQRFCGWSRSVQCTCGLQFEVGQVIADVAGAEPFTIVAAVPDSVPAEAAGLKSDPAQHSVRARSH